MKAWIRNRRHDRAEMVAEELFFALVVLLPVIFGIIVAVG